VRATAFTCLCAAACLALAGCGAGNAVWVKGHLLKGGQPYTAPDNQTVGVTFYAMDAQSTKADEPFAATYGPEGAFEVPGPEGRGIPPGKYRISVIRKPKAGTIKPAPKGSKVVVDRDRDYLNDQFGPTTSPIVREIRSSADLTIDLDNPAQ
jgi:hypothetical protein